MPTYVTTTQLARELGVSRRSLVRWVDQGQLEPDLTTPGGHYRWDVDRVRREMQAKRLREDDDTPDQ